MKALITSDLHLTDRVHDSYRWEIFDFLRKQALGRKVDAIWLLGDITDRKDHHSAVLVNRIIEEIRSLEEVAQVRIVTGNHDYAEERCPFFGFLPGWIKTPKIFEFGGATFSVLPHFRLNDVGLQGNAKAFRGSDYCLMHFTVKGARFSTGVKAKDAGAFSVTSHFSKHTKFISGDVHVPQEIGRTTYCGAPHPVNFGDNWKPRILLWDDGELKSIPRVTIKKLTAVIESPEDVADLKLRPGDQLKIIERLGRARLGEWVEHRAEIIRVAKERGFVLRSMQVEPIEVKRKKPGGFRAKQHEALTPDRILDAFCVEEGISKELTNTGHGYLNE